jgi:hypothetical protein
MEYPNLQQTLESWTKKARESPEFLSFLSEADPVLRDDSSKSLCFASHFFRAFLYVTHPQKNINKEPLKKTWPVIHDRPDIIEFFNTKYPSPFLGREFLRVCGIPPEQIEESLLRAYLETSRFQNAILKRCGLLEAVSFIHNDESAIQAVQALEAVFPGKKSVAIEEIEAESLGVCYTKVRDFRADLASIFPRSEVVHTAIWVVSEGSSLLFHKPYPFNYPASRGRGFSEEQ